MKHKVQYFLIISVFFALFGNVSFANVASAFKVDNDAIDAIFAEAVETTSLIKSISLDSQGSNVVQSNQNSWGAFATSLFLSGLGVRRHHLLVSEEVTLLNSRNKIVIKRKFPVIETLCCLALLFEDFCY